jgi:hypothetical protein
MPVCLGVVPSKHTLMFVDLLLKRVGVLLFTLCVRVELDRVLVDSH